jgi:hypothetical protein
MPCIAFTNWSDVAISFPMVSSFSFSVFFLTLSLPLLMAKWMIHERLSPSNDGVGHIFLTSSSVYKIPSPISKDFQGVYPYKTLTYVLSFDKH